MTKFYVFDCETENTHRDFAVYGGERVAHAAAWLASYLTKRMWDYSTALNYEAAQARWEITQ